MSLSRYEMNHPTSPCPHKASTGCSLLATRACCACNDRRPFAPAYPVYIDGEGIKYQGTRWERYCWKCKDYWNASCSAGPFQLPTFAQGVPTGHRHITSPSPLSSSYPRMPPLPLSSSFDNNFGENSSPNSSYPVDGSNERIARLRSELQGVRTGIQRIVSGLQDLNETTHQQELAAQASFSPFTMPTRSTECSPPRASGPIFQGNLEASTWSNIQSPTRYHQPSVVWNPPRLDAARPRPSGQDPMLRVRQRAYLESGQQRYTPAPHNPGSDLATRNSHGRSAQENPLAAVGGREEVQRPDHPSSVPNMYGNAWGEHRNAEAARQGQHAGPLNALSPGENRRTMMPNPLANPPNFLNYAPPYVANSALNVSQPYLNPIGLQSVTTPDLTPPVHYHSRDLPAGLPSRWTLHHLAATGDRRQQNTRTPDRASEHADNTTFIRRASEANRRVSHRGESEGGVFGRALEQSGIDLNAARTSYPYMLPGGLPRAHFIGGYQARDSGSESESEPSPTFDTQDRPPPMDPESMMLDMACSVCKEHLIDTVVLPCGHAVMCNWCADLHVPGRKADKSIPKDRSAKCPMCRSRIKQKFKIFHA